MRTSAQADYPPLPCDLDAERFVLAWILQNQQLYPDVARRVALDDFSLLFHRRVFQRMGELYIRKLPIDIPTLAKELDHHKELGKDGFGHLVDLDTGMPAVLHLDGHIRILHQKHALREAIVIGDHMIKAAASANGNAPDVVARVQEMLARFVEQQSAEDTDRIHSLSELQTLDDASEEIAYLDRPTLPQGALVAVSGLSGHGKSTFMTALARDLTAAGTLCLILDRENPRPLVAKRFRELGINRANGNHPGYWGLWEREQPPMPDDPRVLDWVRAGLRLIIVDSKTSYLAGENENDSAPNSAFFTCCRRTIAHGATVAVLINTSEKDKYDYRGHTIVKDLVDHAVRVSNFDPDGIGLLHTLSVKPFKSRFGDWDEIKVHYASGKMIRTDNKVEVSRTVSAQLRSLLAANPGITKRKFYELAVANRLADHIARNFVELGLRERSIRESRGPNNRRFIYLAEDFPNEDLLENSKTP
jgi:hypothetical protein